MNSEPFRPKTWFMTPQRNKSLWNDCNPLSNVLLSCYKVLQESLVIFDEVAFRVHLGHIWDIWFTRDSSWSLQSHQFWLFLSHQIWSIMKYCLSWIQGGVTCQESSCLNNSSSNCRGMAKSKLPCLISGQTPITWDQTWNNWFDHKSHKTALQLF